MLHLEESMRADLARLMRTAPKAHLRRKATALWNLSQGKSQRDVAVFLGASKTSVSAWVKRFREEGTAGLEIRPGRGRPPRANPQEVEDLVRQSPRNFGLPQTRWTLASLAHTAPSLKGFSPSGVWRVLERRGLRYKRGQPHLTSPDPAYLKKRAAASGASRSPETA